MKSYTTRQEIENYLLMNIDPTFHPQVDRWIEDMEAYIDRRTGRDFAPPGAASKRTYDGSGEDRQVIDDCSEVTKVEIGMSDPTEIVRGDYLTYPENAAAKSQPITRLEFLYGRFPRMKQSVHVTAKWGSPGGVPHDIRFAATVLVSGIVNRSYRSENDVASMSIGRYSVSYRTEAQIKDFEKVEEILKAHKKFTF